MLFVRGKAAGLSIEDVLNSISGNLPPYRFAYLIEKAKAYAATLQGFGAALLSALEKKDIEELNQMRTRHQKNILKFTRQVRIDEYNAAVEAKASLEKRAVSALTPQLGAPTSLNWGGKQLEKFLNKMRWLRISIISSQGMPGCLVLNSFETLPAASPIISMSLMSERTNIRSALRRLLDLSDMKDNASLAASNI